MEASGKINFILLKIITELCSMPEKLTHNTTNHFLLNFLTKKKWRIARHTLFIITFFPLIFSSNKLYTEPVATYTGLLSAFLLLCFIYINVYVLFPEFLSKGKYVYYFLFLFLIIGIALAVDPAYRFFLQEYLIEPDKSEDYNIKDLARVLYFFPWVFAATMAVKLYQTWLLNTEHITELRQQNLQSELTQLKSQINPHFLFNTLNNINTLTQTNPGKASEVIIKLSDLLRYQLYDSTQDQISLKSDIVFLENFLNIEKLRRDNFNFSVNVNGDTHTIQIPPFMFIPFIENATKHSVNPLSSSYVRVNFNISNDALMFECENSITESKKTNLEPGGIGLANIRRRLELLYEGRHELVVSHEAGKYYVKLILKV